MNTFTLVHVLISLAGIAAGLVTVGAWMAGRNFPGWTILFLVTTALTSITGFFFPFKGVTPGIAVGVLSLVVLAVAAVAGIRSRGAAKLFLACCTVALYFNFFVLLAQSFQHTPALRALAPTQSEPPFAVAQFLVLVLFIGIGVGVLRGGKVAVALPPR